MSRAASPRKVKTLPTAIVPAASAEIVTVLASGEGILPQRRRSTKPTHKERLVAVLGSLLGEGTQVAELNFTTALAARSSATLRALAADLECYSGFCLDHPRPGLPASPERLTGYIGHLEARRQSPATISRKVASLGAVHRILDLPSATAAPLVRDALRGMRKRQGVAQRQAGPLRFGAEIGREPAKGLTLTALLDACGGDPPGLRDAALLSLGYDAGLRVSELVAATCESVQLQDDGSGLLHIERSKTDQLGEGSYVWVSPDTMRRIALWRDVSAISAGPLFCRIAVRRRKVVLARRALTMADLAPNAKVDRERMAAVQARDPGVTYAIGSAALTPTAVRHIIKRRARAAADAGLVTLMGKKLDRAIAALSTHSLRVGLTQELFAGGADAGPVAQALRWTSTSTALRYGRKLAPASNAAAAMLGKVRR